MYTCAKGSASTYIFGLVGCAGTSLREGRTPVEASLREGRSVADSLRESSLPWGLARARGHSLRVFPPRGPLGGGLARAGHSVGGRLEEGQSVEGLAGARATPWAGFAPRGHFRGRTTRGGPIPWRDSLARGPLPWRTHLARVLPLARPQEGFSAG